MKADTSGLQLSLIFIKISGPNWQGQTEIRLLETLKLRIHLSKNLEMAFLVKYDAV